MDEDFSSAPPTLGELRSDRSQKSSDWTLRDALIEVLRQIDQGVPIRHGIIVYAETDEAGQHVRTGYRNATEHGCQALGLLARASHLINEG